MMTERFREKMNFRARLCGMNAHYRFYSLERFFQEMQRLGIENVEIWTGPMHFYVDYQKYEDVRKLKHLAVKYGIHIVGICPEQTNPKPNNVAISDRKEEVYQYYCHMIDIAKQVEAKHVLITTGWAYYDEAKEEAWMRSVAMMQRICSYAHKQGIDMAIEALQLDESILVNSVSELKRYKEAVGSSNLKVCIDFGAMARVNDTIQDYFDAFGEDIIHIHFVDGNPTGHLAWSHGKRNLIEDLDCLQRNKYTGYLSLETATSRYYEKPWSAEEATLDAFQKIGREDKK